MNPFRRSFAVGLFLGVGLLCLTNAGWSQIWARIVAENKLELQAMSPDKLPINGTFWSFQRTNMPPWPFCRYPDLPVYYLGYGNSYLIDDSSIDYEASYKQREEERSLRKLEWEAGLLRNEEFFALEGSSTAMMMSSMLTSYAYGNGVYLVEMAAAFTNELVTASLSIAGGTNNVPYDILMSTNVAATVADWNWIGIGYTSNRYTFSNQPAEQAFYTLAKPQKTMTLGWGNDVVGQCSVPAGLSNALMVAGGGGQSLAVLNDGSVVAWGKNNYGQGSVPNNVTGAVMVAAGYHHNVALRTNGSVVAWGLNYPPLGYTLTEVPADLTNATVISAQALHTIALRSDGTVVGWGYSPFGETNVPSGLTNVVAIAAGFQHNLAAKEDSTVVAWGNNANGQCNVPAGLSNVWDVAAGVAHSVALRKDGTVIAWGRNTFGETAVPVGLSNVVAIVAGGDPFTNSSYSIALKKDNTLTIWGSGEVVTQLSGMSNVIAIANGADHALAIRSGPRTPVITLQPTDQFQVAGGTVIFTARGAGLYGVSYQWKTNGVNLAGATNANLTLTNVQAAHAGYYSVTVSNEVGTITSPNATLTLVTAPIILTQTPLPTNQVAIFQKNLTLSVTVNASGQNNGFPLRYQWKFNGTNISGATSNSYSLLGGANTIGAYTVVVTNTVGSTSANWQVTNFTYAGSYVAPGTFAYHLATNLVARTNGFSPGANMVEVSGWTWECYYPTNLHYLTNAVWSTNFWLQGVKGLSATAIGFLNRPGGQGLVTMVSPRHCLFATHMHVGQDHFVAAFLDTNNVIHWRTNVESVHMPASVTYGITNDMSVGILNEDLPPSVGYVPVLPPDFVNYLPTNNVSVIQGIGMNQNMQVFSQPMTLIDRRIFVDWSPLASAPLGLNTNWNILVCCGDSSGPERLLIGNQLVLAAHNFWAFGGPIYALQINTLNLYMHYLSTNNAAADYQLNTFSLTNWPVVNQ